MMVPTTASMPCPAPALEIVAVRDADHLASVLEGLDRRYRRPRREALRRRIGQMLGEGTGFLVARCGGTPLGLLAYRWARGALEVVYMAEKPGASALGVIQRLLQTASQIGISLGASLVSIHHLPGVILPANAAAARRIHRPSPVPRGPHGRRNRSRFVSRAV